MIRNRFDSGSILAAALAVAIPVSALGADSATDSCAAFEAALADGLLEPFENESIRDQRASILRESAEADCRFAVAVAAGLHTQGDAHPARLLPKDLAAAERGFLRLLEQGNLAMFSRLSFLASARGDWEAAMGWAQLAGRVATMVENRGGRKSEAEATRLLDLFAERSGSGEAEAKAAVAALMEARGDTIRSGLAAYDANRAAGRDPRAFGNDTVVSDRRNHGVLRSLPPAGYKQTQVVFLLGVGPDGRVARRWWFDAVPDAMMAKPFGAIVDRFRFDPSEGPGIRWAVQPILYVDGDYGLGDGQETLSQRSRGEDGGPF